MDYLSHRNSAQHYHAFSVLVVDDEIGMQSILQKALRKWFSKVDCAGCIDEAEILRTTTHYDLIILDINLPGRSGIEWEAIFAEQDQRPDVIFMTGYADLEIAISALQLGAADFILKPFNLEQMLKAVERCMDKRLHQRMQYALQRDVQRHCVSQILGQSPQTEQLKQLIMQFAPSRASVLIEGESGTGKELVARGIHEASERQGPFVPVNCGAIAPELLESELFGHTQGAFTGAKKNREGLFRVAHGGTLFLDEIGEMPLNMQSSLLRVLEQRTIRPIGSEKELTVDVRIVAATNRNLYQEVEEGRFRADLYYRLNVLKIEVLPLRERKADLHELVPFFTQTLCAELSLPSPKWAHEDISALFDYSWPGNIRELKNLIERSLLIGQPLAHHWQPPLRDNQNNDKEVTASLLFTSSNVESNRGYPSDWTLKQVEKAHIKQVVAFHQGNKSAAARDLGVARKTLERKFKEWESDEPIKVR